MNKDTLIYHGDVKIIVGRDKYRTHNAGENALFNIFARILLNDNNYYPARTELPTNLDIRKISGESVVHNQLVMTREIISTSEPYKCRITTAIRSNNLNLKSAQDCDLCLLDGSSSELSECKVLASVQIDLEVIGQIIDTGRQALIEWDLYVDNT